MGWFYFGTLATNRTMTLLTSTAIRLPLYFIETTGKIMNSDYLDLPTGQIEFNNHGAVTTEEAVLDQLSFLQQLIQPQSLQGSALYVNPLSNMEKVAKVNPVYRV